MRTKKQVLELENEIRTLFLKADLKPPRRILPNILFDWMDSEYCFKVRIRALLSEIKTRKNFGIDEDSNILCNIQKKFITIHNKEGIEISNKYVDGDKADKLILIQDEAGFKKAKIITNQIKKLTGIDIEKI